MAIWDPDISSPPEPCGREGCCRPFTCVCPEQDVCHLDRLEMVAPKKREELEMPVRE